MVATLFVKLTDSTGKFIQGDSKEVVHDKWIVVDTVGFKTTRAGVQEGGSATRGFGKADLEPIEFSSEVGSHTMPMILASISGLRFKEVLINQCKSDESSNSALKPYIKWKLSDCLLQSYGVEGSSEDIPKETWSVTYSKIECEFWSTDNKTGKLTKANDFKWDSELGKMA